MPRSGMRAAICYKQNAAAVLDIQKDVLSFLLNKITVKAAFKYILGLLKTENG